MGVYVGITDGNYLLKKSLEVSKGFLAIIQGAGATI